MEQQNKNFKIVSSKKTRVILPNMFTLVGVCIGLSSIKFALDENFTLSIIAIMTLGAVGFELYAVYQRGSIELADLLLMFIYAEVLGMVAIYFRSHVLPVIYPLFIGITALARLIVLQGKDSMPEQLIYEAGSILLLSLAALLLKDVKVTLTHNKKKT